MITKPLGEEGFIMNDYCQMHNPPVQMYFLARPPLWMKY